LEHEQSQNFPAVSVGTQLDRLSREEIGAESALNELCSTSIFFSVSAAPSKYNAAETGRLQLSAI
jgi:hypothetical protein